MKYYCEGEWLVNKELGQYYTHGIASNDENIVVHDVSADRTLADKIVDLLNKHDVSLLQVNDVIEDMITGV